MKIRDKDGNEIGEKEKQARRVSWEAEKTQGQKITLAIAAGWLKESGINPESPKAKEFLQKVGVEAKQKEAEGKLPKAAVLDSKAQVQKREGEKSIPRPRRGAAKAKEKEHMQEQAR